MVQVLRRGARSLVACASVGDVVALVQLIKAHLQPPGKPWESVLEIVVLGLVVGHIIQAAHRAAVACPRGMLQDGLVLP